ncbi:hypothetical protein DIPPA_00627 [Diplonema papillatum]|nr:hypothetical protein DIPPA_00627 [Diplonema papillatum]
MGKSAKATRGGNKLRKNPIRDATATTDSLKTIAKKAAKSLNSLSKKDTGGAIAKGQLPAGKVKRVTTSTKKKCIIK